MKLRILVLVAALMLTIPSYAQDDAVNPSELELSGTPEEICEAATPAIEPETRSYTEPSPVLEGGVDYRAVICTSAGAVYLDLFEGITPVTVNNFVFLAEQNYYNNTIFHRVIEDFMAQGGDPTGTGTGGPGYQFIDEFISYVRFDQVGLLAMANSGPTTNGSQFFITTAETSWLNDGHTIFGEVLAGQAEAVDNILIRDPQADAEATSLDTVVIIRDPELVDSDYEEPALPEAESVATALDSIQQGDVLPEDIAYEAAEILETEAAAEFAPEDLVEDYAAFLEENGHQYRVATTLDNTNCNEGYFFSAMSYEVDVFDSYDDAWAVLSSEFLPEYYDALGYTAIETADTRLRAYYHDVDDCGEGEKALTVDIQYGRLLVNISVIYNSAIAEQLNEIELAQFTVSEAAPLFEFLLSDIFRQEA